MSKFRPGDRVRRVKPVICGSKTDEKCKACFMKEGAILKISMEPPTYYGFLDFENGSGPCGKVFHFADHAFELVKYNWRKL